MEKGREDGGGWVDERLDALVPHGFTPDAASAWARLRDRRERRGRHRLATWAAMGAAACVIVLLLPWPRAAAARLWDRLTLGRVEVVSVDDDGRIPDSVMAFFQMREDRPLDPAGAASLDEAQRMAGFAPSLPSAEALPGTPSLSVVKTATMSTAPIRVGELRELLARIDAAEVQVPDEWEGASLTVEGGPMIVADYADAGVQVMQSGPVSLTMRPGFELERFMEIAFRVFGRNAEDARRFGGRVAANPPLLMVLTPGHHSAVREITFPQGTGILVGDPEGGGGICLFLNLPDRMFFISASRMTEARAVAIARSLR